MKILLVDDNRHVLDVVGSLLESEGHVVLRAPNGIEGLTLYEKERPALIITDIRMPYIDGISFIDSIRTRDRRTPVIVLTAYSTPDKIAHVLSLGVQKLFSKPFAWKEFIGCIEAIDREQSNGTAEVEQGDPHPGDQTAP